MKILSFGEILWDIYPNNALLGGAPLNLSAHLAKFGVKAYVASALGNDDMGEKAFICAKEMGLQTEFITTSDKPTGKCMVSFDDREFPKYDLLTDTAYDNINISIPDNTEFDAFYFGTLALRTSKNKDNLINIMKSITAREIFCDVNIREPFYSDELIEFCVSHSTIIKISREELPVISESLFKNKAMDYKSFSKNVSVKYTNIKLIIITRDADGAYVFDARTNKDYESDGIKTTVVATVGAGDSFSAMFLYSYLQGMSIEKSLHYAIKLSSFVVSQEAAIPDYSYSDIVDE